MWYNQLIQHLPIPYHANAPFDSVFKSVVLPEAKIVLHFVSLKPALLHSISVSYFADISTQCEQQGLQCIHIWEDYYRHKPLLIQARINALLGKRKRIHARQTQAVRIDKPTASVFLNQHHLQGDTTAYYKFALMAAGEAVAVATFSKARTLKNVLQPYKSYELVRFANRTGTTVAGGLSKLITAFIKTTQAPHVMTYADRDWGYGKGYEKIGFTKTEITPPGLYYIDMEHYSRSSFLNHPNQENCIPAYTSGSIKYTLFTNYLSVS
jgi:hypothetical protein